MTTVRDVVGWLDQFAPLSLAESWDNVGLLLGDPAQPVERILTCLTLTRAVAEEAIREGVSLIVSHHPIFFRPVQKLRADQSATEVPWLLARAGIAVHSPHTAFDNAADGINALLASRLQLRDVQPLRPIRKSPGVKIVVFTPDSDRQAVLDAAFQAGAGRIGNYERCSFGLQGEGTFLGNDESNPTIGQAGQLEKVAEWRLEFVCPSARVVPALDAIRRAHSYEEPAIDVYPLEPADSSTGAGRVGRLESSIPLRQLVQFTAQTLGADPRTVAFAGDPELRVERLAIVCGAGDDFLGDTAAAGAQALLTGEARFHRLLEAESLGLGLVIAGHHATERPGVEHLAARLSQAFPALRVWPSAAEHDPLRPLAG